MQLPPSLDRVLRAVLALPGMQPEDVIPSSDHQYHTYGFCHGGDNPRALSITWKDSATYLCCHTSHCSQDAILTTLGIRAGDLYDVRVGEGDPDTVIASPVATTKDRPRPLTHADIRKLVPPEPLINGWLDLNTLVWLHGKPGSGKSFVALDMAAHISTGREWHGNTTQQGVVLYVAAEGTRGIGLRSDAWAGYHGVDELPGSMRYLAYAPQLATDMTALSWVLEDVDQLQPAMVVLDTQARMTAGLDENSATDMGRWVDAMDRIRNVSGCCVVAVHHESRTGTTVRGSTSLEGAADTMIRASRKGQTITLSNPKQKEAEEFEDYLVRLIPYDQSALVVPAGTSLSPVGRLVEQMDKDGLPNSISIQAARDYGVVGKTDYIASAVRIRKARDD